MKKLVFITVLISLVTANDTKQPLSTFIKALYSPGIEKSATSSLVSSFGINYTLECLAAILPSTESKLTQEIRAYTRFDASPQDLGDLTKELTRHMSVGVYAYTQTGIHYNQSALDTLKTIGANHIEIDFTQPDTASQIINDRIATDTQNRIKNLITAADIKPGTALGLLNTLFVKTPWKETFTEDKLDFVLGTTTTRVKSLTGTIRTKFTDSDDATLFTIDTEKGIFSLIIKLPQESQQLSPVTVDDIQNLMRNGKPTRATLNVPYVSLEATLDLKDQLKASLPTLLGDTFFKTTLLNQDLKVGTFKQKVIVKWDHQGFEGAAATFMAVVMRAMPMSPPLTITVNRPFSFVFTYNDKKTKNPIPLFSGEIRDIRPLTRTS